VFSFFTFIYLSVPRLFFLIFASAFAFLFSFLSFHHYFTFQLSFIELKTSIDLLSASQFSPNISPQYPQIISINLCHISFEIAIQISCPLQFIANLQFRF
jgi:hypothetical protein